MLYEFKVNFAGKPKVRMLEGRPHYVFRVRMWKGNTVLNSNDNHDGGPTLFRTKYIRNTLQHWNHRPIVLGHPKKKGIYVTASSPETLNKYKVGVILRNRMVGDWQESEAWIDQKRIHELEPRFQRRMESGRPFEVSTGLKAGCVRKKGVFNGKRYNQVATDFTPDHLAILMDERGACSCAAGCGMFAASRATSPNRKCSCNCQRKDKGMTKKQKRVRKRKVDRLINAKVGWKKKDREWLSRIDGEDLQMLLVQAKRLAPVDTKIRSPESPSRKTRDRVLDERDDEPQGRKRKRRDPAKAKKKKRRVANSDNPFKGKNAKQIVKMLPKRMAEMFTNGLRAHGLERKRLIDIIASAENSKFTKEELRDESVFDLDHLKKLASMIVQSSDEYDDDYSPFLGGAGAPSNSQKVVDSHLELPGLPPVREREDDE
jgi:hypothetical protein